MELTHLNDKGLAYMVEISDKQDTKRVAVAEAEIVMNEETIKVIMEGKIKKGNVLSVAQVAGIMAAKRTSDIIPMCHNINLSGVNIEYEILKNKIKISGTASTIGKTGVEMEALTAVSVAALAIYDMCKAIDKNMNINNISLVKKTGGKSEFIK